MKLNFNLNEEDKKLLQDLFKSQSKQNLNRIKSKKNKHFNIAWNDSLTLVIAQGCKQNCKSCFRTFPGNECMNPVLFNRMLNYASNHFHSVSITGGEPTEHIALITKYSRNYPDLRINITTNGEDFNNEVIEAFKTTPNILPLISLNGIEDVHDKSRYIGSFTKTYESILKLITNGIPFGIISVVNQYNLKQIISEELAEFVNNIGACTFELFQYYPIGNNESNYHKLMLSSEQIDEAIQYRNKLFLNNRFNFLFKAAQLPTKRCNREIQINVDGSISYCPFSVWGFDKVYELDSDEVISEKINRHLNKWNDLIKKSTSFCPLQSNTADYIDFFENLGLEHSQPTGILDKKSFIFSTYCSEAKMSKMLGGG